MYYNGVGEMLDYVIQVRRLLESHSSRHSSKELRDQRSADVLEVLAVPSKTIDTLMRITGCHLDPYLPC